MQASVVTEPNTAPKLEEVPLVEFSVGYDPDAVARLGIPISADTGSPNTLVYLEVDPGRRIPLHTHSSEEVFVVLAGEGIVTAGDRQWSASAGAIAVAPAFTPHGWENTGSETLKLAGFFGANALVHEFEAPVSPFGVARFATPILD
jgi:quercetin dioxygenase-like cupin family protein